MQSFFEVDDMRFFRELIEGYFQSPSNWRIEHFIGLALAVIVVVGIIFIISDIAIAIKRRLEASRYYEDATLNSFLTGEAFEEYIAWLIQKHGYSQIQLTNRTGDFGADIIATKDDLRYAIQVKLYNTKVNLKAVQEVYAGAAYYDCDCHIVATNNFFSSSAYELANKTNTILWDRHRLSEMRAQISKWQPAKRL